MIWSVLNKSGDDVLIYFWSAMSEHIRIIERYFIILMPHRFIFEC